PRRRQAARRHPARPRRAAGGSGGGRALPIARCAAVDDRRGARRERGQLCPI
ncbi:hypothetical protein LTR94_036179, partial [Friedmanniomyces endolithicus]